MARPKKFYILCAGAPERVIECLYLDKTDLFGEDHYISEDLSEEFLKEKVNSACYVRTPMNTHKIFCMVVKKNLNET